MMPIEDDLRRIDRALVRGNFIRRPATRLSDLRGHKEWMHFCVSSPQLDLLVNFSVADDLRSGAPDGSEIGRLVCAVRGETWDGDVDDFGGDSIGAMPGTMGMRLGDSSICYRNRTYRVRAKLRKRDIELDLSFYPTTIASQINNISLGDGPPLKWFLVPRLLATGVVIANGETFELRQAPAYHDHNWGYFSWGQDFSWVWGYANSHPIVSPWSVAFDRLSDRKHTTDYLRGLVLWHGPHQCRVFGGRDIRVREEGRLQVNELFKLPPVLGLLRPELTMEVPRRFHIRCDARGDVLEMELTARSVFQIIAPNDHDLGVTIINEVCGDVVMEGRVGGRTVHTHASGMFEFLGG